MPHKDAETRRAYDRAYHDATRGRPTPLSQERPGLPPYGTVVASDDGETVQCHVCGRWYVNLAPHARLAHGLDGDTYRAEYRLARNQSLASLAYGERRREIAQRVGTAEYGRAAIREGLLGPRPRGIPNRLGSRIKVSVGHRPAGIEPMPHVDRGTAARRDRVLATIIERPGILLADLAAAVGACEPTVSADIRALGPRVQHRHKAGYWLA